MYLNNYRNNAKLHYGNNDADGERTVKCSGSGDHVFVNGTAEAGLTETQKFTLYVGPWLVANEGGRYTKHIYAGAERLASKTGTLGYFSEDPRSIHCAGSKTDGVTVDYKRKYNARTAEIGAAYSELDIPYAGTQNDNFEKGPNFSSLPTVGTPDYSDPAADPISPYIAAEMANEAGSDEGNPTDTEYQLGNESGTEFQTTSGTMITSDGDIGTGNGASAESDSQTATSTEPAQSFGNTSQALCEM